MKNIAHNLLMILMVAGIISVWAKTVETVSENQKAAEKYLEMSETYCNPELQDPGSTDKETSGETYAIASTAEVSHLGTGEEGFYERPDLDSFFEKYPNAVGWIKIDGTNVNYPIMQNKQDNSFYLTHDIDGKKSSSGAIYLDSSQYMDIKGLHTLYGHRMKNGTMFKGIVPFLDKKYMNTHRTAWIYTRTKTAKLRAFACYEGAMDVYYATRVNKDNIKRFLEARSLSSESNSIYACITCNSVGDRGKRIYLLLETVGEQKYKKSEEKH